jgi:hypothetical protein
VFGNGVHHDTEGQDVRTHNENREEQLAEAEQLASKSTEQDLASVGQVLDVGVSGAELVDGVSSIGSENSQSDNEDDSWGKADLGEGLGEGQDTQRDGFSDHD